MITYRGHTQHPESDDAGDTQAQRELAAIGRGNSEFLVRQASEVMGEDHDDMAERLRAARARLSAMIAAICELVALLAAHQEKRGES